MLCRPKKNTYMRVTVACRAFIYKLDKGVRIVGGQMWAPWSLREVSNVAGPMLSSGGTE